MSCAFLHIVYVFTNLFALPCFNYLASCVLSVRVSARVSFRKYENNVLVSFRLKMARGKLELLTNETRSNSNRPIAPLPGRPDSSQGSSIHPAPAPRLTPPFFRRPRRPGPGGAPAPTAGRDQYRGASGTAWRSGGRRAAAVIPVRAAGRAS